MQFLNKEFDKHFQEAKNLNVCINCLYGRHKDTDCALPKCSTCGYPHHILLHQERKSVGVKNDSFGKTNDEKESQKLNLVS